MGRIRWERERIFVAKVARDRKILILICMSRIREGGRDNKIRRVDGRVPKKAAEGLHCDPLDAAIPTIKRN